MSDPKTIIETTIVPHAAFVEALNQLELLFKYAPGKSSAEGLAIIGESGTGKTSVLEHFAAMHPSRRGSDGMEVPILQATVPSTPTVKSLAGVLLAGLGDTDFERGTENEKSFRLRVLMKNTGTRMVMLDEFQHFYNKDKHQIMYHVADWLKVLIDQTKTTLVVAGLPNCRLVIEANEQLTRRFQAHIQLPRFCWTSASQRKQFVAILGAFNKKIAHEYEIPEMNSNEMAFRYFCATGGFLGNLTKILQQALRTADVAKTKRIGLEDLRAAHQRTISQRPVDPFVPGFQSLATQDVLDQVSAIGKPRNPVRPQPRRATQSQRTESAHAMLAAS